MDKLHVSRKIRWQSCWGLWRKRNLSISLILFWLFDTVNSVVNPCRSILTDVSPTTCKDFLMSLGSFSKRNIYIYILFLAPELLCQQYTLNPTCDTTRSIRDLETGSGTRTQWVSPQEIEGILKPLKTKEKGFSQPAGHLSIGCTFFLREETQAEEIKPLCCRAQGRTWVNHAR